MSQTRSKAWNDWWNPLAALSRKENVSFAGWTNVSTYQYGVNAIGQRESVDTSGSAFASADTADWQWKYNLRGELASARNNPVQPASASSRFYEFDGIGNRLRHRDGVHSDSGGTLTSYTSNALNQYTAVNTVMPYHDDDGNMAGGPIPVSPTGASFGWDGQSSGARKPAEGSPKGRGGGREQNRPAYIYPWAPGSAWAEYLHDALGRRVMKTVTPSGGTGTRTYFLYDGWNLIAEYSGAIHTTGAPPALTLERTHAWGTDLSGSAQGAGGVGGLLATYLHNAGADTGVYYPTFDGNGNVSEYLDSGGAVKVHFEYDPFGNTLVNTDTSNRFPIRFSTKYQDQETGLYYYGYRDYDPLTGRWPSRDPIEEEGGVNLYGFVATNAIDNFDVLGLWKKQGDYQYVAKQGDTLQELATKVGASSNDWSCLWPVKTADKPRCLVAD